LYSEVVAVEKFTQFLEKFDKRYVKIDKNKFGKYYYWIKKVSDKRKETGFYDKYRDDVSHVNITKYLSVFGPSNVYPIEIDFTDLFSFDKDLATGIIRTPKLFLKYCEKALKKVFGYFQSENNILVIPRFRNYQDPDDLFHTNINRIKIKQIKSQYINKMIEVEGIVVRVGWVRPQKIEEVFYCKQCNSEFTVYYPNYVRVVPIKCENEMCRRKGPFISKEEKAKYVEYQKITIQERHEEASLVQAKTLDVILRRDLVDKVKGSNVVRISGILKSSRVGIKKHDTVEKVFLEANYVEAIEQDPLDEEITPEDEEYCKELAKDPKIYDRIIDSIAPSIYGHQDVKEAIMYLLFEGSRKKVGGIWLRGLLHILLVGDPGVAKSQILQSIKDLALRCIYTTGKGSTAAGLTGAMILDKATGQYMMEAGVLVICDLGVACIDEFDKMNPHDRSAIHEAMEQNRVSIAKAGQVHQLNARTSIIAAANPTYGRYDLDKSISDNMRKLPISIINRFDYIFIMKDIPQKDMDEAITDHILMLRSGEYDDSRVIPPNRLAIYQKYARKTCDPMLSQEAKGKIKEYFLSMRRKSAAKEGNGEKSPIAISWRQLEAITRTAEARAKIQLRKKVTIEDAEAAIRIMNVFLRQVAFDEEAEVFDMDKLHIGKTKSRSDRILSILDMVMRIKEKEHQKYATIEQIVNMYKETYPKAPEVANVRTIEGYIYELQEKGFLSGTQDRYNVV